MKTIKILFLICFFILGWSLNNFTKHSTVAVTEVEHIQQNPLADDETNPIKNQALELTEIDLEENDETNSSLSNPTFHPSLYSNSTQHPHFTAQFADILHLKSNSNWHILHTSRSFLNIFRI